MSIKNEVIELWEKGFTSSEMLEILPYSKKQINSVYTKWKIHANRYTTVKEDNKLKQFIIGSLLGDASITKISGFAKHSRFSVSHKLDHKDYTIFKYNFLGAYKLAPSKISYNKINDIRFKKGYYEEAKFKSKSNPYFDQYRKLFYPNDIKIVPNIIRNIDAFGLAIWYMDDGSVTNDGCNLATNCFTRNENELLLQILKENFNINGSLQKCSGSLKLYIGKYEFENFRTIVAPYIIPIMKYKLLPYNLKGPE